MGNKPVADKGFIAKTPRDNPKTKILKFDYKDIKKQKKQQRKAATKQKNKSKLKGANGNGNGNGNTNHNGRAEEKTDTVTPLSKLSRTRQISGFHMQLAQNLVSPQNKIARIATRFDYVKTLGTGATGRVLQVIHKENGRTYALKELLRTHPRNSKLFVREVVILKQLSKVQGIMQIYDTFMDKYCYFICVEFCNGGDLLTWILQQQTFSERKAADFIKTTLIAIQQMHLRNIVHRDLKPNNMVFDKPHITSTDSNQTQTNSKSNKHKNKNKNKNKNKKSKSKKPNIFSKIGINTKNAIKRNAHNSSNAPNNNGNTESSTAVPAPINTNTDAAAVNAHDDSNSSINSNSNSAVNADTAPKLQIIDFGDSQIVEDGKKYKEVVGTMQFVPPELYQPRTGPELKAGDMWSIGVLAFVLVCGMLPFNGNTTEARFAAITLGKYQYPPNIEYTVACKHFIDSLLQKTPTSRLTVEQALNHEWILSKANTEPLNKNFFETLRTIHNQHKLQQILANVILTEMSAAEKKMMLEGLQAAHTSDDNNNNNNNNENENGNGAENDGNAGAVHGGTNTLMDENEILKHLLEYQKNKLSSRNRKSQRFYQLRASKVLKSVTHWKTEEQEEHKDEDAEDEDPDLNPDPNANANANVNANVSHAAANATAIVAVRPQYLHNTRSTSTDASDPDIPASDLEDEDVDDNGNANANANASGHENEDEDEHGILSGEIPQTRPMGISISVDNFRDVMDKSDKKYNVDEIVEYLDPEQSGFIDFQDLAKYHKRVNSVDPESIDSYI